MNRSAPWLVVAGILVGFVFSGERPDGAAHAADSEPLPPIFRVGAVVKNAGHQYWIREVRGSWIRAAEGPSGGAPEVWVHVPASPESWQLR